MACGERQISLGARQIPLGKHQIPLENAIFPWENAIFRRKQTNQTNPPGESPKPRLESRLEAPEARIIPKTLTIEIPYYCHVLFPAPFSKCEQNGCRHRFEGYLSCQQRLALDIA